MRRYLILDADDTLWENNIYFERAFAEFADFLDHSTLTHAQVRAIFNEMEIANIRVNGYGSKNFARNLTTCYRHLAEREIRDEDIARILDLGQRILDQPIELIPGVSETLDALASRHELTLFTKGDPEEQRLKIERSGLAPYFRHAAIVREKDPGAYERLVAERAMDPAHTWMIGNSPKSDINPALQTGLNAILIPHEHTWMLEHASEIPPAPGRQFLVLDRFSALANYF
jgi:putative hydrolase of the HAD superfamily